MSKVTPEQIEKEHAALTNKTYKLERLDALQRALGSDSDATVLLALGALRQLSPGRIPGLRPYATAVYNGLLEDWLPEVELPKLFSEGVVYTGRGGSKTVFAELDGAAALVLSDSIRGLGDRGRWEMRDDGSIMLSCKPSKGSAKVVEEGGEAHLECRDAGGVLRVRMNLGGCKPPERKADALSEASTPQGQSITPSDSQRTMQVETRMTAIEDQVAALSSKLTNVTSVVQGILHYKEMTAEDEAVVPHWNKAESLPPVGCDLLIKVPKGSYPHAAGKADGVLLTLDFDEEMTMSATRVCHVQQRGNDLTYRLHGAGESFPGFTIKGQFEWTYP